MSEWTARPATRPCVWRVESPFETLRPALRPTHAARSRALSAPSTAVACGRPRRGAVAALVPRWSHDDDHLPGGRVTRALPPPAKGHGRGAWCKRRNRTAGGRWGPHLPGQPASRLHPHALVRAAFDNAGSDRHGLWVRHADTHAQSNTPFALNRPRRSARHGRDSRRLDRCKRRLDRCKRRVDRCKRRVGLSGVASRRVSRGESTLHGVHSPGRVAARGVHSPRGVGPLGAARRPGRRSTRRGESTAASTCAAATSSAGPSYRCVFSRCVVMYRSGIVLHAWCLHVLSIQYMRLYRRFSILHDTYRYMASLSFLPRGCCCACVSIQEATELHKLAQSSFLRP